ncbi:response regulator containing CheY-like receiver domain and AraC-type DNA-binding domain [Sphaerochaeta pleomorpha str. Grapes]|uniref:Response regulator containing CheY-like receiver domain and AraC-type DNA-binding domain n=1 Tax=Sphaerochaeta pleomorpha (strain ATCC BAA-1885 / DSM 22778 / Grapes) TaxID=158190 RepID=G8QV51_SPHPG|nr:AraC family transcriptional regulator [Sphaerochaeta pleomorpha]AEV29287.1 response regulator containing CheY-like receiver domain and AraC-type DNA-binding domain [Sphaerochaeta pleomorpha str. Grapes]
MKIDFLSFVMSTFEKESIHYTLLEKPYANIRQFDRGFRANVYRSEEYETIIALLKQKCQENAVFLFKDRFETNYTVIRLPETILEQEGFSYLVIGPFLDHHLSSEELELILADLKVPVIFQNDLKEYFYNTKVMEYPKVYYSYIEVIVSFLFGKGNCQNILEKEQIKHPFLLPNNDKTKEKALPSMKFLEQFQEIENAFFEAVERADTKQALALHLQLCTYPFGNTIADPLRREKNKALYCNALLHRTTVQAQVHPGFTAPVSSSFVREIETAESKPILDDLLVNMIETYCHLIREHSLRGYPAYLKEVINYIDFNYTENLSLRTLSEAFSINPSYLSMLFKKKTAKTLTEYINDKRIAYSMVLLKTTDFPINIIARETGFEDVNYFTRLFKKTNGIAPRSYRMGILADKSTLS